MKEIHYAAARGDLETVQVELKNGVDVNDQARDKPLDIDFPEDFFDEETIASIKKLQKQVESFGNGLGKSPLICACGNKSANIELIKLLLDSGADINAKGGDVETCALAEAIRVGPVEKVKFLIDAGANINYKCLPDTVAWYDLAYNHTQDLEEITRLLVDRGIDYKTKSDNYRCLFSHLIWRGELKVLKSIFDDGADKEILKWSELMWQVVYGSLDDVKNLIENGDCNLSEIDCNGRTAWLLCALLGDVNKAKLLYKYGAKIHDCGPTGEGALHMALKKDHVQMVRWLLSIGLDIEQVDMSNSTPLMIAAEQNAAKSLKVLLEAGANKAARGDIYDNILTAASGVEVFELLVSEGLDVNFISNDCYTALKSAAEDNDKSLTKSLLRLGANTETSSTGDTALHKAIYLDHLDIAEVLLDAGANPNAQDIDGDTPLNCCQSKKAIDLLLRFGADLSLVDLIDRRADESPRNDLTVYLKTFR
ncbi:MAG: ankyrin repeat domain-containing protein [Lentisphaeraceae bacterium]|nr:ankyrin repeat domain-containing protein [Lentisphaeraceae bacterium]